MAALELLDRYTYEDYKKWEGRWELIDGIPYAMSPAPYPKHQRLLLRTAKELMETMECKECEVFISPIDWKVNEDTVVQPDVAIFCEETQEQYFTKTPPVAVEVLSEATAYKDLTTKFELYERTGVHYYVVINPKREVAEVFYNKGKKFELLGYFEKEGKVDMQWNGCEASIDFKRVFT
ncbi:MULTISPECIES: Uma2 family endonuclease [unclassified Nitratiruptor]|uniref:Uma2 family endonuclease n=1 Tax=unclassified Nitratiruptor TaxID=2624044 RepID=UPI001915DB40|nr:MULTISPECIES: Uma2 family endonuclease [unclassified Nitratiruptor]BCD60673.1 hypothetical protein NitYY0810_C1449 [Nitratiruptor sp. YY08-10]BCD64604.1 hypothetical protein NitYY0814_C1456 [Nitratiruptor sp. YY08-14]